MDVANVQSLKTAFPSVEKKGEIPLWPLKKFRIL
jgi:hypothetical protein